jgi:hypothetical protein
MRQNPQMPLAQFCATVNALAQAECLKINRESHSPFSAMHHDMPESMLSIYWEDGLTPKEAMEEINSDHDKEGHA